MTGADHIEVPGQSQSLGAKNGSATVSELISDDVSIKWTGAKGVVSGTVKENPEKVKTLYGDDEQDGHFFPIKFDEQYYGTPVELSGREKGNLDVTPSQDDPYLIIRLENLDSQNKLTAKVKDTQEEIFELDFSGITKAGEP